MTTAVGARLSTRRAWNTARRARRPRHGSPRRGTRRSGRRGRRWTAQAANKSHLLDSRQPSSTEVLMRLIGLAVALTLSVLAPLVAEAQPAGKTPRIGVLASSTAAPNPFLQGLRDLGYVEGRNLVIE